MAVGDNLKEYKKIVGEARDLTKVLQKDIADSFVAGLRNAIIQVEKLEGATTKTAKAQKKLYEDSIDLTKDILENVENIGTEEFKTLDVATRLAKARKLGDKKLVDQLTHLKSINQQQKQQNKQIQSAVALAKKPFEAVDSFIRQIPIIGDLLGDVADFTGLGDNFAGGIVEGFTSGFVENADLAGKVSDFFAGGIRGAFGQKLSAKQIAAGFGGKEAKDNLEKTGEITGGIVDNFRNASAFGRLLQISVVGVVAVAAKAAASMVSFANSTGLAYKDMLAMGGALLFNADAVRSFADELGTVNNLTTMQALTLQIQEKRYGLSAESAAKLFAVQRGITGSSMEQFLALTKSTAEMARLAVVAPKAVFDDLANSAEAVAKFTDATGDNVFRAAIAAREMGINLGVVDNIAESLLNFEESIAKEQELSMLMGRQINFNKARELFFNNKTADALKEVKAQMGVVGSLSEMDFVQRKAAASALGIQVSELGKIITSQEGANKAAEGQTLAFLGSMAAAAAIGAVLIGTVMALKTVFFGPGSLIKDMVAVKAAAIGGAKIGAGLGAGGMAIYSGLSGMTKLADGGVIVGEAGPEVVAPLPSQGVNIDNSGVEKRIDRLIEQNEFLMNRLTNRIGQQNLA